MRNFFIVVGFVLLGGTTLFACSVLLPSNQSLDKVVTLRVSLPETNLYQVNIDGVDYLVNSRGGIVKK